MTDPWKNKQMLKRLYCQEGMTTREVGKELGCNQGTIVYWMDKHGIERRDQKEEWEKAMRKKPARFETDSNGYERWRTEIAGTKHIVRLHRLMAVAEHGFDAVVGNDVHHKNGIPWDNRPENIEIMTHSEHSQMHNPKGVSPDERSWNKVRGLVNDE